MALAAKKTRTWATWKLAAGLVHRATFGNWQAGRWKRPRRTKPSLEATRAANNVDQTRQLRRALLRDQAFDFMVQQYPGEVRRQRRKIALDRARNLWKAIRKQETKQGATP